MKEKINLALKLISSGDDKKYFQGLCLLMEIYDLSPESFDPVARALVDTTVRPVVNSVEKSMGISDFENVA